MFFVVIMHDFVVIMHEFQRLALDFIVGFPIDASSNVLLEVYDILWYQVSNIEIVYMYPGIYTSTGHGVAVSY